MAISYNLIRHSFRVKNSLTMNEYAVADTVRFYSVSRKYSSDGWCGVNRSVIAKDLGFTERGVRKIIDGLVDKGFLEKGKNNLIRQTIKWDEAYENQEEQRSGQDSEDRNNVPPQEEQRSAKKDVTPYSIRIKGIYIVCDSKEKVFEEFIKLYGKTNDKSRARKKFLTLKPDVYQDIFDAVPHYVNSTPEIKFRKNAVTWLNGECWNDIDIPRGLFAQAINEPKTKVEPLPNNEW